VLLGAVDAEAAQLDIGGRLAAAEVDAPVGEEIERGDALGDAGRVVVGPPSSTTTTPRSALSCGRDPGRLMA
jgi:hypothetical protein